ncbi:MAG: YecA family protein [Anaerolineae bacterium]
MKVGRNDPCPCGSGKKYKHCCLKKEKEVHSHSVRMERADQTLFNKMTDFANNRRFTTDLWSAFDLYWDRRRDIDDKDTLNSGEALRFVEWYLYEYRTAEEKKRIIDIFLDEKNDDLEPEEKVWLDAWRKSVLSIYQVTEVQEGIGVHLHDVLQELDYEVDDPRTSMEVTKGEFLMARLFSIDSSHRLSRTGVVLPQPVEEDLVAFAQEQFEKYQEVHYQATWPDFLREMGYLFNHFLLDAAGEEKKKEVKIAVPESVEIERGTTLRRFLMGEVPEELYPEAELAEVPPPERVTPSGIELPPGVELPKEEKKRSRPAREGKKTEK